MALFVVPLREELGASLPDSDDIIGDKTYAKL